MCRKACKYCKEENGICIHFLGKHYIRGLCDKKCEFNEENIKQMMEEDSCIDYRKC